MLATKGKGCARCGTAVALMLDEVGIRPEDEESVGQALSGVCVELRDECVLVNGLDVSREIRTPHVDRIVSAYSAVPRVRAALLGLQRDQQKYGSLVVEGRDVGSVVFPDAPLKFFLTASPEARAGRRCLERERRGEEVSYEDTLAAIRERDHLDESRTTAPLRQPEGAVLLDTSDMSEDEVVKYLEDFVHDALLKGVVKE